MHKPRHDRELWATDGATTALVCDLNPGPSSSAPRDLIALRSSIISSRRATTPAANCGNWMRHQRGIGPAVD
jgi:ELWxxDGT repeat protein